MDLLQQQTYKLLQLTRGQLLMQMFGFPIIGIIAGAIIAATTDAKMLFAVFIAIMILVYGFTLLCWLYGAGVNLYAKLLVRVPVDITSFIALISISAIYITFFAVSIVLLFGLTDMVKPLSDWQVIIAFCGRMFVVLTIIYSAYFIARCLKTVQLDREVTWRDYWVEMAWLIVFPIGIWMVQPTLNEIFLDTSEISKPLAS